MSNESGKRRGPRSRLVLTAQSRMKRCRVRLALDFETQMCEVVVSTFDPAEPGTQGPRIGGFRLFLEGDTAEVIAQCLIQAYPSIDPLREALLEDVRVN